MYTMRHKKSDGTKKSYSGQQIDDLFRDTRSVHYNMYSPRALKTSGVCIRGVATSFATTKHVSERHPLYGHIITGQPLQHVIVDGTPLKTKLIIGAANSRNITTWYGSRAYPLCIISVGQHSLTTHHVYFDTPEERDASSAFFNNIGDETYGLRLEDAAEYKN